MSKDLGQRTFRQEMRWNNIGYGFSIRALRQNPHILTTVLVCGSAVCLTASYITYMLTCKTDFSFRPWAWKHNDVPYNWVGPTSNTRMYCPNPIPRQDPLIEKLKQELANYRIE
eukprot:GHVU01014580.1.p1 GENE.GHVU01014580.1~~GHVU01014580.1.p1  ORF type:complete len:114 (+),score=3.33 GHVU01014580.1:183-524(+)